MPRVLPSGTDLRASAGGAVGDARGGVDYARLHRHLVAAELAAGRRALLLGCGDGEGAALVAGTAAEVVAVVDDPVTVDRARQAHRRPNLRFVHGSPADPGEWAGDGFGFVAQLDTGLPLDAGDGLLGAVVALLDPTGTVMVWAGVAGWTGEGAGGSPNGEPGRPGAEPSARLEALLRRHLRHVSVWAQRVTAGSQWEAVVPSDAAGTATARVLVSRRGDGWERVAPAAAPHTLVGIASRVPPPAPGITEVHDCSLAVVEASERERERALDRVRELTLARDRLAASFREELHCHDARLMGRVAQLEGELAAARAAAQVAEERFRLVIGSRGWRALQPLREARSRLRPVHDPAAGAAAATATPEAEPGPPPAAAVPSPALPTTLPRFPPVARPVASIVVPVFNQVHLTVRCLAALAPTLEPGLAEVIVVDDASTDATAEVLRRVEGIRVVTSETNRGFAGAAGSGAAQATGRVVVFLNNDTEVRPGWLDALLETIDSAEDVGAVGCRLLFPDGRLQEAGGIIWRDGTGANYGRGDDPEAPPYTFRREVDYCSGSALMVRRDLFERVGGFDPRFAPAYYEDTDLCFSLRELGYRVLYEPRAVVVHLEGGSHGTDDGPGPLPEGKARQHVNRHLFVDKWSHALARHLPSGTAGGLLGGRLSRRPRVLVCDAWIPRHDRDSGGLRMTWILRLLRELGCEVTLVALDGERREPYADHFRHLGIEVHLGGQAYADLVRRRERLYDVVLLSRPQIAAGCIEDTRRHQTTAAVVYDAVDLQFVRELRRLTLLGELPDEEYERARGQELEVMRACDVVAAITQAEAEVILEQVPGARTVVLPNVHELDRLPPAPFEDRAGLLFLGGFDHAPNVDAARHLVEDVLPLVRDELDAPLWLVGSNPPPAVTALAQDGVVVTGYVPDVEVHLRRARVFVAPLRYGAGMKGKNGHALSHGLPVVTTTVGAEGMDLVDGTHALVRDDPRELAAAVVRLYRDRQLWERLSASGMELVGERWTPEAMRRRLLDLLRETAPASELPVAGARPG
jgi:GT2 family glycosyltransferase/glycosyltransferase involved in cell wall biosynthesis